jgi:hypothetical protein
MLNPFEGKGVAGQWIFEMLPMSNQVSFATITDVQLVVEYTALSDADYRQQVLKRLPKEGTGVRAFTFCADFSDACFHLKDSTRIIGMLQTSDGQTGAHTLVLQTRASDFPPNQRKRRLKDIIVYCRSKGQTDYSTLKLYLACKQQLDAHQPNPIKETDLQPVTFKKAETPPASNDPKPNYLGRWNSQQLLAGGGDVGVVDTWYLYIPPGENAGFVKKDEKNQDVLIDGHEVYDFSGLQDVIFALYYEYDLELPSK